VIESNAQSFEPLIDQDFSKVKASLYELSEAEMNLVDDSQKLNDMQREYFAGKVDLTAVERARNELIKSKSDWFLKVIQYLSATNDFEPTIKYQITNLHNRYQNLDELSNINFGHAIPSSVPVQPVAV